MLRCPTLQKLPCFFCAGASYYFLSLSILLQTSLRIIMENHNMIGKIIGSLGGLMKSYIDAKIA